MLKMNTIPSQLSELFDMVGVRFFDEWSKDSVSRALVLFRVIKAKEVYGKWFLSDIQNLVAFICETENEKVKTDQIQSLIIKKYWQRCDHVFSRISLNSGRFHTYPSMNLKYTKERDGFIENSVFQL